ncbi:hypothetical protein PHMEG_00027981 [Phytophthora megakarya]|uniref:Uncharacterized protein n=1 Tax=Phytophthora megakarya TaxID=4795 RepID=A0A225V708_9STRA|nr:hypothetical protein PHMEG_00027981 [Phytophthora megakarya]
MYVSCGVLIVGVLTQAWRMGNGDERLEGIAPGAVLSNALESVRKYAERRRSREEANLRRLREDNEEHLTKFINVEEIKAKKKLRRQKSRARSAIAAELREVESLVEQLRCSMKKSEAMEMEL